MRSKETLTKNLGNYGIYQKGTRVFKGLRELLTCYPLPLTLGGLQLCGEEKQEKNIVALLAGKTTVKFELSLIGLRVILNIDMVT